MTEVCSGRVTERLGRSSYSWNRHQPSSGYVPGNICRFWLSGNCTRNPCRFLHPDKVAPMNSVIPSNSLKVKQSRNSLKPQNVSCKRANEEQNLRNVRQRTSPENVVDNKLSVKCDDCDTPKPFVKQSDVSSENPSVECNDGGTKKPFIKICEDWMNKSCVYGEKCDYLHSWSSGDEFSKMGQLEGHHKTVTGINLPSGSDKLFTTSEDGTVRAWNCNTGECMAAVDMGALVWCLESDGSWLFAGITNAVKVWNTETQMELSLDTSGGQVYSLAVNDGILFAGLEDGLIFRWMLNSDATAFEGPTLLRGHTGAVVSLFWGANLYSGSLDKTVRVWDRASLLCIQTLQKHSEGIMSVLCWEQYLLSSSFDKTLKVWATTDTGKLDVTCIQNEDHGIVSLDGMYDAAGQPILLCSCSDNSVRLYELPLFKERGRIYAKDKIRTIHIGPKGLFFTGDGTGVVSVWRCSGDFSGQLNIKLPPKLSVCA